MESIFNYLKDPGWWFSTVLVAIVASVIAGFLKDRISILLSHFSQKFQEFSAKRKIEQEELINILVNNQAYLSLALLKVIFMAVIFMGTTIKFLLMPIYAEIKPQSKPRSQLYNEINFIYFCLPILWWFINRVWIQNNFWTKCCIQSYKAI
jgi:hypothetical protein